MDGMASRIASPSSISIGFVAPKASPFSRVASIAASTDGCAWPRIAGPHAPM
jgi:hypothetical protein